MAKTIQEPIFFPKNSLGIKLDFPEQFLDKAISPYSRNMEYIEGKLQGRAGLTKLDTTALPGAIQVIDQYWLFTGANFLMVLTTKDITYYDFTNTYFVFLNPLYTTGTITIGAGTPTIVAGSGTSWDSELKAGDYIKIGTGNVNSDATWYLIDSVDSATQLTLSTAAATCSGSAYVARKTFAGESTIPWSTTVFVDKNLSETYLATNGIDAPVRWTGTGQVTNIANLPTGMTAARYVNQFKDRVIWMWTVEGGNHPQRLRCSDVADCESYDDLDFWDFPEGQAWITGGVEFADYFVVMRERGARVGRFVGGDDIFDFEVSTVPVGCNASQSIVGANDSIFYYGIDNMFHRFNILREEEVSADILPYTKDFDPNLEQMIFGWDIEWKNHIRWFVPYGSTTKHNACVVYDYARDILEIWEYENSDACSCIGEYLNVTDIFCDDTVWGEYYCDEQQYYMDDRTFLDAAPVLVYGGYDGIIRKADVGANDDGTEYTRLFKTKRLDFRLPNVDKRLWEQEWVFDSEPAGTVTLSLIKGNNLTAEANTKTISLVGATKDKIQAEVTWDKTDDVFQFQVESDNHFAMYGFFNYLMPKGKTFR
jgi:hypothetical protein